MTIHFHTAMAGIRMRKKLVIIFVAIIFYVNLLFIDIFLQQQILFADNSLYIANTRPFNHHHMQKAIHVCYKINRTPITLATCNCHNFYIRKNGFGWKDGISN